MIRTRNAPLPISSLTPNAFGTNGVLALHEIRLRMMGVEPMPAPRTLKILDIVKVHLNDYYYCHSVYSNNQL